MIEVVKRYLKENIDETVALRAWDARRLPIFLRATYDFHEVSLLGCEFLLLSFLREIPRVSEIKKHKAALRDYSDKPIVLCHRKISSFRRKTYLKHRIPFIVESGQVYLPFMSLDVGPAPKDSVPAREKVSRAGQIAFLLFLYDDELSINATAFAERFGLSPMTASRALNELYDARLLTYTIGGETGRRKDYSRRPDGGFFMSGESYLSSPVKRTVYVTAPPAGALVAGMEALADQTSLSPSKNPVRALYYKDADQLEVVSNVDRIQEERLVELQLWKYDPSLFSVSKYVDPASLYLSFQQETDERTRQALKELMEGQPWYAG